jgi:uncharacterized RDD family membrane protein YckC
LVVESMTPPSFPPNAALSGEPTTPAMIPASALPRAGFWIRTGAMMIDLVIIGTLLGVVNEILPRALRVHMPAGLLLSAAAYAAVMWKVKGTTIGGIICGLKVARLDDRPIDWATAIVRALGCFVSLTVAGLGFIWVAFDDQRQSWHDKIGGTIVVKAPKGSALV